MKDTLALDSQPQRGNGTTSTGSPKSWRERLQEGLPMMVGWESIRRGMKNEDDLSRRDALAHHEAIHGERGSPKADPDSAGAGTGHLVLGDMTTEYHYHEPAVSVPGKKGLSALAKAAAVTGLLGASVTAGVGIPIVIDVLKENPPTIEIEPGEIRDWKLGQPVVE